MSIHKEGDGWVVRWREPGSGKNRSRKFDLKRDAQAWEDQKRDEKRKLGLPTDATRMTFEELWDKFLVNHIRMLEDSTQEMWRGRWMPTDRSLARGFKPKPNYIGHKWANYRLAEITFDAIKQWHGEMKSAGCSAAQMFDAHDALIAVLEYARMSNIIQHNVASQIKRPRYKPPVVTDPWLPDRIEAVRFHFLDKAINGRRDFRWARARDAAFVSVLAYVGLRTWDEAARMSWDWLMERSVLIPESKNHTARAVPMPEWVRDDLRAWRIASGLRRGLVFPRSPEDLRPINSGTWTREVWATALGRILGEDAYVRPYHLRHSRVSMWIAEGHDVQQVARWAGHRPEETLKTYAHLFEDRDTRNPLRTNEVVLRVRQMFVEGHRGKLPAGSLDVLTPREADGAF